jgi:hypothetical protein
MKSTVSAVEEKVETTIHSMRYELREIIQNRMEGVVYCLAKRRRTSERN